jgi:hypothetical protein
VREQGDGLGASRQGPAQLHRIKELVQRGDAEGFANLLNLDAHQTRQWFDEGFRQDGYGAEVIRALGTLVLTRILTTSRDRNDQAHG